MTLEPSMYLTLALAMRLALLAAVCALGLASVRRTRRELAAAIGQLGSLRRDVEAATAIASTLASISCAEVAASVSVPPASMLEFFREADTSEGS